MKLFECQHCGQLLFFENTRCERCGYRLGYLPREGVLSALIAESDERWRPLAAPDETLRFCANAAYDACNWLIAADDFGATPFCRACRLNRTVPDLGMAGNLLLWQRLEAAKHRLVYGLLCLGLPLSSRFDDPEKGDYILDASGMRQHIKVRQLESLTDDRPHRPHVRRSRRGPRAP